MKTTSRVGYVMLLAIFAIAALAADPERESCEQIRARIGQPPLADPDLLRSLSARGECRFTAGEVYRAAYGDRPVPKEEPRKRHHHGKDDGDED